MLLAFPWPGNVRQLQNVVRNIVVLHDGDVVTRDMIPPPVNRPFIGEIRVAAPVVIASLPPTPVFVEPEPPAVPAPVHTMPETTQPIRYAAPAPTTPAYGVYPAMEIIPLAEMERRMILAALARTDNDIPRAAALLEVNPSTVYRKVSAWRKDGLMPA